MRISRIGLVAFSFVALFSLLASTTVADWDPQNGDWGKEDATHIRVMTYNILDNINSQELKVEQRNPWTALARIVAAMKPDLLILQEVGDKAGGVDSVADLETTIELFFHGGTDPFRGGSVTAYVQKYAPTYDLPYIFVSTDTDGFNRNVIVSRFPFSDLNGDGKSELSNIDFLFADEYAPGGDGGIRGFMFAEVDLPDTEYVSDLVIGNVHMKAGGSSSDRAQRLTASQNVAYWIDYLLNGAGTGSPDPNNKIRDNPPVSGILPAGTAVLWGGDLNEDENTNGRKGPVEWLARAQQTGGTDGTDVDRSDSSFDDARDLFTNDRETLGSSKLDYIMWQDSVPTLVRDWIFEAATVPSQGLPPELNGFIGGGNTVSFWASDHLPVLADFELPVPDVTVAVDPQSLSAPVGGDLFFDASVTRRIASTYSGEAWIDVLDPNGDPFYASNPRFGPKSFSLQPLQTKQKTDIRVRVPGSKTPGTGYKVRAYVGTFPNTVLHTAEFEFEITP